MKKNHYYSILLISVLLLNIQSLMGQNILEWNLRTPVASTGTEATFKATLNSNKIDSVILTRGAGAPAGGGCGYGFVGNFGINADKAAAITNNAYYEFKVQAKDGYSLYLKTIKTNIRIQTYAAKTYQWMYSLDGVNFNDIGSPVTPNVSEVDNNNGVQQPDINLSSIAAIQELNSLKRVTFRLYAWGGSTPGTTNPSWVNFGLGKTTTTIPSLAIEGMLVDNASTLAWNFFGSDGKATSFYSTSKHYNLELSNITRGTGSPGVNGNSSGFTAAQTVSATAEEAETNQAYFEFNVKPKSGKTASLTNINANIRTQTYSGKTYQWKYCLNGAIFVNIGSPVTVAPEEVNVNNGVNQALIDLSGIADLQNIPSTTTVTFRLYAWGGSTPATDATDKTYVNFGFGKSTATIPSLIINGTVSGENPTINDIVTAWEFSSIGNSTSPNPSPVTGSFNATTLNANLSSGVLSRGSGLNSAVGLTYSYAGGSMLSTTKEEAVINNEYFQIILSPKSKCQLSTTGLKFKYRRTSSGHKSYCWKYSTDGINFTEFANGSFTSTDSNGEFQQPVDLSIITGLQNIESNVTFRIYLWGATSSAGANAMGRNSATDVSNSIIFYGKTVNNDTPTGTEINKSENKIWISSDPSSIILNVNQAVSEQAVVRISDISGRDMFSKKINLASGLSKITLPVSLVNGIYILSLTSENKTTRNLKFIR